MVTVPVAALVVITPVVAPIAAMVALLEAHVPPPAVELVNVVAPPTHTDELPEMPEGAGLTVIL